MGLTIYNPNTLQLLNILNQTSAQQSNTLLRLSTGRLINRGADNPAGMIALQSLNAEATATDAAIASAQRADSMLAVADGALNEVQSLLTEIESLAAASLNSGGLSAAEIAANQAQIDAAVESIDRIVRTTGFNGKNLLDGAQSIRTSVSQPTKVTDAHVYSRRSSSSSDTFSITVDAAGAVASGTLVSNPTVVSAASFSIAGKLGTATIEITAGSTLAQIRDKIIAAAAETGVSASVTGSDVRIQSREYGESAFVSVTRISGDSDFQNVAHTAGTDARVSINGQAALVDGLRVSFNSNGASGEFTLTSTGNVAGSAGTITTSGGGATFQLGTSATTRATLGIDSLASFNLGDSNTGYLSQVKGGGSNDLATNASNALAIARRAIDAVATARGRVGAFQKFHVGTTLNSLNATKQALADAVSLINDVDYAQETAELSRQNVLMQSATALLGVANQQTANILALLR
ncbi:MAG: flagellin [Phycisphaerae bacterium]|nr:flagellin [Phycisphaerae bacterium]